MSHLSILPGLPGGNALIPTSEPPFPPRPAEPGEVIIRLQDGRPRQVSMHTDTISFLLNRLRDDLAIANRADQSTDPVERREAYRVMLNAFGRFVHDAGAFDDVEDVILNLYFDVENIDQFAAVPPTLKPPARRRGRPKDDNAPTSIRRAHAAVAASLEVLNQIEFGGDSGCYSQCVDRVLADLGKRLVGFDWHGLFPGQNLANEVNSEQQRLRNRIAEVHATFKERSGKQHDLSGQFADWPQLQFDGVLVQMDKLKAVQPALRNFYQSVLDRSAKTIPRGLSAAAVQD